MTTDISNAILDIIASHTEDLPRDQINVDSTLDDIGIDSLAMAEIIFDLEDHFDIEIPEENDIQQRLNQSANVSDLVQLVSDLQKN
jgi:acyl carrier protein